jgi:hypothetical protein
MLAFTSQLFYHFRLHFCESSDSSVAIANPTNAPSPETSPHPLSAQSSTSSSNPRVSLHAESMAHVLVALIWTSFWHLLYSDLDERLNILNVAFMLIALMLYTAVKSGVFHTSAGGVESSSLRDDDDINGIETRNDTRESRLASSIYFLMSTLGWFFYCLFTGCLSSPFLLNFMLYGLIYVYVSCSDFLLFFFFFLFCFFFFFFLSFFFFFFFFFLFFLFLFFFFFFFLFFFFFFFFFFFLFHDAIFLEFLFCCCFFFFFFFFLFFFFLFFFFFFFC